MKSKFVKFFIAAVAVFLLLWLLDESENAQVAPTVLSEATRVSVVMAEPKALAIKTSATGMVKPRWQVTVIANVRGQVTNSYEQILPGTFVKKGQVIGQINDLEYKAAQANAKANLASAELELARVLNEQSVAKRIDNGKQENDFRQYKPHVAAAKAALQAARAQLASVQKELADTQIKAPFDAIVLVKHIVPAQYLNQGESVYTLASSKALDVEVSLSAKQWQKVATAEPIQARVSDKTGQSWLASARYLAPMLNSQTRQRDLLLTIEQAYQQASYLMPQQQVEVNFSVAATDNAVTAPATVLTRDNKVWTVSNNKLVLEPITLLYEQTSQVMFAFEQNPSQARQVVLYPLSTMLVGQSVTTELVSSGAISTNRGSK